MIIELTTERINEIEAKILNEFEAQESKRKKATRPHSKVTASLHDTKNCVQELINKSYASYDRDKRIQDLINETSIV